MSTVLSSPTVQIHSTRAIDSRDVNPLGLNAQTPTLFAAPPSKEPLTQIESCDVGSLPGHWPRSASAIYPNHHYSESIDDSIDGSCALFSADDRLEPTFSDQSPCYLEPLSLVFPPSFGFDSTPKTDVNVLLCAKQFDTSSTYENESKPYRPYLQLEYMAPDYTPSAPYLGPVPLPVPTVSPFRDTSTILDTYQDHFDSASPSISPYPNHASNPGRQYNANPSMSALFGDLGDWM